MDVDQLRAFCQLAEDANYRIAAEKLCITQSALTKKIQRLEESIETPLFDRGRQGAKLTLAGETLLTDAGRLVEHFNSFKSLSHLVAEGTTGHLNIGFGISTYHMAPNYIAAFKQQYQRVKITLNDIPSKVQTSQLNRGELHLSFNRLPVEPPLVSLPLFTDRLVLAVHEGEQVDEINLWKSVSNLNYLKLNPERGPGLTQQIDRYLRHQVQPLAAEQESDDILTLLALVSARIGYTIVPASVKLISPPNIRLIPLSGKESQWEVGLIWNQQTLSPLIEQFINFVKAFDEKSVVKSE
ncbi:LysR family transcriptional regulator [uncultured Vibrio sp.]|uniref:LysR family transcriptional regulator n=1 Tax=uncultured Vibrio sp. TaxID=114054 RepID=UPI0009240229|nr:LysR family transcriptional regulator [uncultured Vibrio sp.]OIQ26545.1 MAG: LysR family transcriptional regulator [Vibrio sp. MedPE-SWchi]